MLVEHCAGSMVVSISGMAGVGKTILAKKLLEDPLVIERYESCIFISVGPKPRPERFLQAVAAQLHDDDEEGRDLFERLNARKFLIVFDDVWDMYDMDFFTGLLEQKWDGSMILFTTRIRVYERYCERNFNLRFMNEKESWDLFRGKVFADKVCPPHLEKAGKKIAANCEGLPLLIVTVADLLSRVDKTQDLWDEVAANKQNPIFEEAYDQLVEVVLPSYHHLPLRLKPCFLYMAVFPQNCEVVESRLTNLLSVEGFVDSKNFLRDILDFLVSHNVVLIRFEEFQYYGIKVFSLHSVFWHLCKKESRKEKFLHILNRYDDGLKESIERQRRLSFYKNVLLAINDVFESVALVSNARSLLCTGVYHQYQVPLCIASLRLLKVLDALTIRFYEFPIELLKLVQLRYLALTYNGNLPSSISKISNLQSLIVHQHLSIKFTLAESYLPVEIWYLQELEHLEVTGRNLPDPPSGVVLPNLLTLLDVGPHSCTKAVLESTPSLEKLRVQTELTPDTAEPSLTCFDHISNLTKLASLECVIVNPILSSKLFITPPRFSATAFYLEKLTLSGFGYPWKDMSTIAKLRFLRILALQGYAFQGEKWEVEENCFLNLQCLSMEDTDLVQWTIHGNSFRFLQILAIKDCYKLAEVPHISSLYNLSLVDCSPLLVTRVKQMATNHCTLSVTSSI